jgi:O-antigen/teichoic acid export membrane protein
MPSLVRFGLPLAIATVPQLLNLRLDQVVMVSVLSERDLGLYVAAVSWSGLVASAIGAIGIVLFPRVASQRDPNLRAQMCARGARLTLLLGVLVAGFAAVATPVVIPFVMGERFRPAVVPALVLLAASIPLALASVAQEGLRGLGYPRVVLLSEGIALIATLVALALLLGPLGIVGAALASLASYSASAAVTVYAAHRLTGLRVSSFLVPDLDDVRYLSRSVRSMLVLGSTRAGGADRVA